MKENAISMDYELKNWVIEERVHNGSPSCQVKRGGKVKEIGSLVFNVKACKLKDEFKKNLYINKFRFSKLRKKKFSLYICK